MKFEEIKQRLEAAGFKPADNYTNEDRDGWIVSFTKRVKGSGADLRYQQILVLRVPGSCWVISGARANFLEPPIGVQEQLESVLREASEFLEPVTVTQ